MNVGIKSSSHKYEIYINAIEQQFEDKLQKEIAENSTEMCPNRIETITISETGSSDFNKYFVINFPSGFVKGL